VGTAKVRGSRRTHHALWVGLWVGKTPMLIARVQVFRDGRLGTLVSRRSGSHSVCLFPVWRQSGPNMKARNALIFGKFLAKWFLKRDPKKTESKNNCLFTGDLMAGLGEIEPPTSPLSGGEVTDTTLSRLLHLWVGIRNAPGILSSNVARIALFALASCARWPSVVCFAVLTQAGMCETS
jgi:hypothetical protein